MILPSRVASVSILLLIGVATADRAGACHVGGSIDVSSPSAQFRVDAYEPQGANPTGPFCTGIGGLPISDSQTASSFQSVSATGTIERPGEFLSSAFITGSGFGSNLFIHTDGRFLLTDLIITGGAATTVSGGLNLYYGGDQTSCNSSNCYPQREFSLSVTARDASGNPISTANANVDYLWGAPETVLMPLVNLPVNTAFKLEVGIGQRHAALDFAGGSQSYESFVQFLASEVFALPDGYTLDSVEGNITNNQWVIPVPAAIWLFGSSLGLLGWLKRRAG